jgi:hypothetical protein
MDMQFWLEQAEDGIRHLSAAGTDRGDPHG